MKKRILVFGPIGDYGGRELEVGFIAETLAIKYEVDVCSSGTFTTKSQLFKFNKNQKSFSLNNLLCDCFLIIKLLSIISYLKNYRKGEVISNFANNSLAKKYFGYNEKRIRILRKLVTEYDLIFICAQLSSNLMNEIIRISRENNKKVLFRTTGEIKGSNFSFIKDVDCYVHHSMSNANKLADTKFYEIIDQSAFEEYNLLSIPFSESEIKKFLILSRLSTEKGIEQVIGYFLKVSSKSDILYIAGDGVLKKQLEDKYKDYLNIIFIGFVKSSDISNLFQTIDCLIIGSSEESGPLVGIESMCAGKIIISTKVGAMQERLENTLNDYFYNYDDFESFKEVFFKVKSLNISQVRTISLNLKENYRKKYSQNIVRKKYIDLVNKILE
ncbi:glycosyltransferase family 4 protein [Flavobacterium faecale]|uniref:glycosyltransferase family 4 protein n=1 Tax=Flavobacterium faecale TaxID=1355330 RepID=UPI003AB106E5